MQNTQVSPSVPLLFHPRQHRRHPLHCGLTGGIRVSPSPSIHRRTNMGRRAAAKTSTHRANPRTVGQELSPFRCASIGIWFSRMAWSPNGLPRPRPLPFRIPSQFKPPMRLSQRPGLKPPVCYLLRIPTASTRRRQAHPPRGQLALPPHSAPSLQDSPGSRLIAGDADDRIPAPPPRSKDLGQVTRSHWRTHFH